MAEAMESHYTENVLEPNTDRRDAQTDLVSEKYKLKQQWDVTCTSLAKMRKLDNASY